MMTEADVKIAAYQEAIDIAHAVEREFGDRHGTPARVIAARVQALMEAVADEAALVA
jgi:hypothetical protein